MKKIFYALLIILLIIIIYNVIYSKFIKHELITSIFGKAFFIVETGSMEPAIKKGELIVVSKNDNYKVGDIVTILDDENYIYTHRIIDKNDKYIITKGDANDLTDETILEKNIIGKVIFHSNILGFFVIYLLKPLIIIDIFLISIKLIVKLYKQEEDSNEKEYNN